MAFDSSLGCSFFSMQCLSCSLCTHFSKLKTFFFFFYAHQTSAAQQIHLGIFWVGKVHLLHFPLSLARPCAPLSLNTDGGYQNFNINNEQRAQRGVLKIKFLLMPVVNPKFIMEFHDFQLYCSRNISWLGDIFVGGLLLTGEQNLVKFCLLLFGPRF